MQKRSKYLLASIAAGSILVAYMAAAAMTTPNRPSSLVVQELDFPPIIIANAATVDYFLKLDGIKGESTASGHEGEIELVSFSWGVTREVTAGSSEGDLKAKFEDLGVVKFQDKSSTKLFLASASSKVIDKVVLTGIRTDLAGQQFMKIELEKVVVSSFIESSSTGELPTENVKLNFEKIELIYRPTNPDGSLGTPFRAGWDVAANKET
jgi:type VI secretion system secreted protein Hcp